MSKDDESGRLGRLGQALPRYSALSEAFGAAIYGATRMTRARAKELAERLLNQAGLDNVDLGEAASEATNRINQLAEEIIAARKANQALLQRTVSAEIEKSLRRLGLARADEVAELRDEIAGLRKELSGLAIASGAAASSVGKKAGAKKAATKKSAAKKTATKRTAAKKSAPQSATSKAASARATSAKKTALKKSAATTGSATSGAAKKSSGAGA
jgi:polyhydroxyalkanoate synthesis regulator phasin